MVYERLKALEGRYEAAIFPLEITPDIYRDYLMGKRRAKKQASIQFSEGRNIVILSGITTLYQNQMRTYTQATFDNCRVGSNTTTPANTDTDCGTVIGGSHQVNWPRVTAQTGFWDTFFLSTENTGTVAEAVICTGSPGTLLTHFAISPAVVHTNSNNMTISYSQSAA